MKISLRGTICAKVNGGAKIDSHQQDKGVHLIPCTSSPYREQTASHQLRKGKMNDHLTKLHLCLAKTCHESK